MGNRAGGLRLCCAPVSGATGQYHDTYAQVGDLAHLVPVDVYVPGCPPRLEDLIGAIENLQRAIVHNG